MKKLTIALLLIASNSFGQITLEYTYNIPDWMAMVELSSGVKYFVEGDTDFTLYNLDHSVYKNILYPTISSCMYRSIANIQTIGRADVIAVSEKLFDDDNEVEFVMSCYDTTGVNGSGFTNEYIVNEDQTIIMQIDTGSISDINLTAAGTKMVVDIKSWDGSYYRDSRTEIYSLPGTELKSISLDEPKPKLNAYPNPASEYTTIEFTLPNGDISGEIKIFNTDGVFIKGYDVDDTFGNLIIDTSDFESGSYYYTLSSVSGTSKGQKLIIVQ